jgi:hypothetical protein
MPDATATYRINGVRARLAPNAIRNARRFPTDEMAHSRGVGNSPEHVLEARLVRLVVRNEAELGIALGTTHDAPSEIRDRDLLLRADVENIADGLGLVEEPDERADHVEYMTEATRLRTVAVDRERFAGQRLANESWDHHSVGRTLATPDGVEEPHDDRGKPTFLVIRVRKDLVDSFGRAIRPARDGRRPEHPVCVLGEWDVRVLTVDLRRARHKNLPPVTVRRLHHDLRAADVRGERAQRLFDDQLHTHRGGEVHDDVALVCELVDHQLVQH